MACELCRAFILDYLHHPLHREDRLTGTFHLPTLLKHKDTVCFWIQRALIRLTYPMIKKAKSDSEMDFYLANQHTVDQDTWNKAFLKNLKESNPALCTELNEIQTACEECGFLKRLTGLYFLESYIIPLLQTAVEIHSEHSKKPIGVPHIPVSTNYRDEQLREEWGDLYD